MDETLLATAYVMAQRGTCTRAQVGCVVAVDGRVLTTGYNGAPRGMAHCVHPPDERSEDRSAHLPACTWSVHAEANAVAFAARHGVQLAGATVYTTLSPCVVCAQLLVNVGAERVVCASLYRDESGVKLLLEAGVTVDVLTESLVPVETLTDDGEEVVDES
jgi:dCMP deaminase